MTRCIECGGLVNSLNEDEQGEPCPACADRLLETLPGVFHRPWMESWPSTAEDSAEAEFADDEFDDAADERAAGGRRDDGESRSEPDLPA